ncbi:six-hairpin glycosidase-like protein [candidate division KSB1 bacterium]|nr:six-hairpin glycosidase-like protein [candidate division KSB1 bacterium]
MKKLHLSVFLILLTLCSVAIGQLPENLKATKQYWQLDPVGGIHWNIAHETRLPRGDNIEMSGRKVSVILSYQVDKEKRLSISRKIFYPMLRRLLRNDEPEWQQYRAYLTKTYNDDYLPQVLINDQVIGIQKVTKIAINGKITFIHELPGSVLLERTIFPSMMQEMIVEQWTFQNKGNATIQLTLNPKSTSETVRGLYGDYLVETTIKGLDRQSVSPGQNVSTAFFFSARLANQNLFNPDAEKEWNDRAAFLTEIQQNLQLETPDSVLNQVFQFTKIRTSESLFETKMGLVHSPGGGNYYGGVWNNDQIEYAAPFFPYLGYEPAIQATLNACRIFQRDMKPDYAPIWSSHEMEGDLTCCGKDRGDAAMYAYGTSRFLLSLGKLEVVQELWPAITWCLEYCERQKTAEGVIASQTDEMEGRIPTGSANLTTSCLTYGALQMASHLAGDLNQNKLKKVYEKRAKDLKASIERYFGAEVHGLHTYRYFDGHQDFRHWICMPLLVGIHERQEATIQALFEKLWTPLGLRVQTGVDIWWDRGTLYALNGVLQARGIEIAMKHLQEYSRSRLLGAHVPYPIEAWPENNQAHLAAESALYCRIFIEGLFGIQPAGLREFTCQPAMPKDWRRMALKNIHGFGQKFDLIIERIASQLQITLVREGRFDQKQLISEGKLAKFPLTFK